MKEFDREIEFSISTPLIQTIISGDEDMVLGLIVTGVDMNQPDQYQASPLYCSLGFYGQPINIKIVEMLLQNGANPNQPMYDGDTPTHMAHYNGNQEAIQLLLQHGANINAKNEEGKTPLHCLIAQEDVQIGTKLEIIGAFLGKYNLAIQDKGNKTILDYAEEHCPEALSLLLSDIDDELTVPPDHLENVTTGIVNANVELSGVLIQ